MCIKVRLIQDGMKTGRVRGTDEDWESVRNGWSKG